MTEKVSIRPSPDTGSKVKSAVPQDGHIGSGKWIQRRQALQRWITNSPREAPSQ
jgi:hypothetical protein